MNHSVCMFVYNEFRNDSRVLKEAQSLLEAGARVRIIALQGEGLPDRETIDGLQVIRVSKPLLPRQQIIEWLVRWRMAAGGSDAAGVAEAAPMGIAPAFSGIGESGRVSMARASNISKVVRVVRSRLRQYRGASVSRAKRSVMGGLMRLLTPIYTPLRFRQFYREVRPLLDAEPADVYHAHDLNTMAVGHWFARRHKAKLVYDSHELYTERNVLTPMSRLERFGWSTMERRLIRRCDGVITVNNSIARELSRRYRVPPPVVTMNTPRRHPTRTSAPENRLREQLPEIGDRHLLLYCGSITFNRGLENLLASLKYLDDAYLVLMGPGREHYKDHLRQHAKSIGVNDRYSFFGPVPPDEVVSYVEGADLGVAPIENSCLSYYLCSPNKLFEYMIAGIPAIASNFPEMRHVIEQHEIGGVFEPNDPADIARAARVILDDRLLAERMRANTVAASALYNWENESKKLIQLYETLR